MKKIICNPLNLEYRYQIKEGYAGKAVFREAADPTMVLFKEKYLLFASKSGGFWYSDNLCDWRFKETPELPYYDYAPDVREVNNAVVFSASRRGEPCTFYRSEDPLNTPFTPVSTTFDFWDPDIFQDDDGRVYFYWGCTNKEPIWGIEMDAQTLLPIGEKVGLIDEDDENHIWERTGENNRLGEPKTEIERLTREHVGTKPFIEGAFMNKHGGLYYLQYAAPGTQYNTYSDGVYVGEGPLGPFKYQRHNPFSSKPGGFIHGAGHGSTFQDKAGNWWHTSTMRISCYDDFERRLGLFPCGFDEDGTLYCNQNFADYPFALPEGLAQPPKSTQPEWMLLSYNKNVSASSSLSGHEPQLAVDENIRTWWAAENKGAEEWFEIDLGEAKSVHAIQLNLADEGLEYPQIEENKMNNETMAKRYIAVKPGYTKYILEGSENGSDWHVLHHAASTDYAHDFILLENTMPLRYVRVSGMEMPYEGLPAISGLRIFGKGGGSVPKMVSKVNAARMPDGAIALEWDAVAEADGYNIRYGLQENKLYSSWQVFGTNKLDLTMINGNMPYYIAIDSFNENGVTEGTAQLLP